MALPSNSNLQPLHFRGVRATPAAASGLDQLAALKGNL